MAKDIVSDDIELAAGKVWLAISDDRDGAMIHAEGDEETAYLTATPAQMRKLAWALIDYAERLDKRTALAQARGDAA